MLLDIICNLAAQTKCYQCFGLGAKNPLLAQAASQYPISSCYDIGARTNKVDCTGKCYVQNFTVNYAFQQPNMPNIEVDYVNMGCGGTARRNGCQDFSTLPNIDEVRQQATNVVAPYGGRVNTMRGEACFCAQNLCNSATTCAKTSFVLLVACLALSMVFKSIQ
ncbi:uncharacterized protein [Diadema antillarum]|uniref:uncharacterized protein n=1 Tax=Diadema antillarum TaxID=105358 RepID=UPI003A844EA6